MNKLRNNLEGLRRLRKETQEKNTSLLIAIIQRLEIEKPDSKWSYKYVCALANLKSQNALKAPWNLHVKKTVDAHNDEVKNLAALSSKKNSSSYKQNFNSAENINSNLKIELEQALQQVSIWEAESAWFAQENNDLKIIIARLEKKLNLVSEELATARKTNKLPTKENSPYTNIHITEVKDKL